MCTGASAHVARASAWKVHGSVRRRRPSDSPDERSTTHLDELAGVNRYVYGRWLGATLFVVGVAALAFTYPPSLALGAQMVALAAAGALFVFAGTDTSVRDSVGPHRLMGAGDVLLGASLVVSGAATTGGDSLVYLVAVVLGGGSLVLIGVFYIVRPSAFGLGDDGYPVE